jgi:hypothetical protein
MVETPMTQLMAVHRRQPMRGEALLLLHCSPIDYDRPSARARLRALVGADITRLLLRALTTSERRSVGSGRVEPGQRSSDPGD